MKTAVVFAGRGGIDDLESRSVVARIPEVSRVIKKAQMVLEDQGLQGIGLMTILTSSCEDFQKKPKLRGLLAALVQVGLFERLSKFRSNLDYIVGNSNGDSAMKVCLGQMSIDDLVMQSRFVTGQTDEVTDIGTEPRLAGVYIEEYCAFSLDEKQKIKMPTKSPREIAQNLSEDHRVTQIINLGPGNPLVTPNYNMAVGISCSLELDPMLSWIWEQTA